MKQLRNNGLFVSILLGCILLVALIECADGAQDNVITIPAKVCSIDKVGGLNDVITVITPEGNAWMFRATPDHTNKVGDILLITIRDGKVIDAQ